MRFTKNYRPKYSLSIEILSMIMPPNELRKLIDDYVKAKKDNWKESIKGK